MFEAPLSGVRILAMEQAVALPVATRHLADMGAEIIRVQSQARRAGGLVEIDLTRNKRQLALDLSLPGAPEAFLRVAANCDVVAHNYTPRVVRKFGIDYAAVRRVNPSVIYLSLTGFGTTGPWGERPLFGPGAEAVSGHNLLIGERDGWPGRPGTIVYADTTCGLNAAFAIIAALEERERTGAGQHIDISLYETSVSQLGPVIVEAQLGAMPERAGNGDDNFALHGVFDCQGHDRHIAVAVRHDQVDALRNALELPDTAPAAFQQAVRHRDATDVERILQGVGIAASVVADSSVVSQDAHLWSRNFFGLVERTLTGLEGERFPHTGPSWGGGPAVPIQESRPVGADSFAVLAELGGFSREEIESLVAAGATSGPETADRFTPSNPDITRLRVDRGELSRVDRDHSGWVAAAAEAGVAQ